MKLNKLGRTSWAKLARRLSAVALVLSTVAFPVHAQTYEVLGGDAILTRNGQRYKAERGVRLIENVSIDSLVTKGFQRRDSQFLTVFGFQGAFTRLTFFWHEIERLSKVKKAETLEP